MAETIRLTLKINSPASPQENKTPRPKTGQILFARIAALIIGVVGLLAAIALFIRLTGSYDLVTTLLLVLAVIIAVLGVICNTETRFRLPAF